MIGVRVVGGALRGRRLAVPDGVRPTSDRAREALFDILGPAVSGSRFLDLYAGSGAVAIEALSRGAAATAVERAPAGLLRNRDALGVELDVIRSTVSSALGRFETEGRRFDFIFADPPYGGESDADPAAAAGLLRDGGVLIWQTDAKESLAAPAGLALRRRAVYGRNVFHLFGTPE